MNKTFIKMKKKLFKWKVRFHNYREDCQFNSDKKTYTYYRNWTKSFFL